MSLSGIIELKYYKPAKLDEQPEQVSKDLKLTFKAIQRIEKELGCGIGKAFRSIEDVSIAHLTAVIKGAAWGAGTPISDDELQELIEENGLVPLTDAFQKLFASLYGGRKMLEEVVQSLESGGGQEEDQGEN